MRKLWPFLSLLFIFVACTGTASDWTRRDMPTDGLTRVVTYNLRGPAGTDREVNAAQLRGVNSFAPTLQQETIFGKLSGSTTQDIQITLEDGSVYQALGMIKTKRFGGLTRYMSLESATYSGVDALGNPLCGAKIRLEFNRNFAQYVDPDKRDWDSLWYYDIPCTKDGANFLLDIPNAQLRAVALNEVWQARIAAGSFFFNWGHSVTAVGGVLADLPGGWWLNWDVPGTTNDTLGAVTLANQMVLDLENSHQPWLEFKTGGQFANSGTHLIYSASDADQYATFNRIFLNRQNQYAVFYRPDPSVQWDSIIIRPIYNYEWNDAGQQLAALRGWNQNNPFHGLLTDEGLPKDMTNNTVKEFERIGWMNAPNASLEQIQYISLDETGAEEILYVMTVRAFIGANDTLVMFGPAKPPSLASVRSFVPSSDNLPRPLVYDEQGKPMSEELQTYTPQQWAAWQAEASMWNFLRDNPDAVGSELQVQYRFADNTSWTEVYCRDSDGDRYVCGYRPVEWDLSTSYYFDGGNVRNPWLVSQLLGEVGVRTLGMSYASGLYQGTGMLFAMAQIVHRDEFFAGYGPESIWTFDARASQLPDRLAEAWAVLEANK